jgi:transcriptional regulator with XRE-family HTH domain
MVGIGARLRSIRRHLQLSLRDVAQRSRRIARDRDDASFQVSTSWLSRLERREHEFTVNKLLALAEIYRIPIDQLVRGDHPKTAEAASPDQVSPLNPIEPQIHGSPKAPLRPSHAVNPVPHVSPDATMLLSTKDAPSHTPYLRGVIGKLDLTLNPMVPAGSIVQIDTSKREIAPKKTWTHEFQRPIYFLKTKDGYFCGWCGLDEDSHLTLIPHPLSSAPGRRWEFGTEVEIQGRVMSIVIQPGN